MTTHPLRHVVLACMLLALPSCTLSEGSDWGQLAPTLAVTLEQGDRLDAQGAMRVGNGYVIQWANAQVNVRGLEMVYGATQGAQSFDVANPPEGYSLCHNGHCHSDDGKLVPYEDIEAAQAALSGQPDQTDAYLLTRQVELLSPSTITPKACPTQCPLRDGALTRAQVSVDTITLSFEVVDTTQDARLAEPLMVDVTVDISQVIRAPLDVRVGTQDEDVLNLRGDVFLRPSFLDGVDWPALQGLSSEDHSGALRAHWESSASSLFTFTATTSWSS